MSESLEPYLLSETTLLASPYHRNCHGVHACSLALPPMVDPRDQGFQCGSLDSAIVTYHAQQSNQKHAHMRREKRGGEARVAGLVYARTSVQPIMTSSQYDASQADQASQHGPIFF